MTSADWIDLLNLIPPEQHSQLILITRNGVELAIDSIQRTERSFLAFRGRVCGNTDDGRLFFVPYAEITCVYINRFVMIQDVSDLLGENKSEPHTSGRSVDSELAVIPADLARQPKPKTTSANTDNGGMGNLIATPRLGPASSAAVPMRSQITGISANLGNLPGSPPATPTAIKVASGTPSVSGSNLSTTNQDANAAKSSILERLKAQRSGPIQKPR